MGGFMNKQIVQWINLEDLQQRFAPYVLRRLKTDCLDLPEKIPSVALTVPLSEKTWEIYKSMRDEMVAWLSESTVSVASQAIVKAMRLAQVTSGYIGGLQESDIDLEQNLDLDEDRPDWLPGKSDQIPERIPAGSVQEVGHEKLKLFLQWLKERIDEEPNFKVLVWCRFRPELARLMDTLRRDHPYIFIGEIRGGQKKGEREVALRLLDPRTTPEGSVVVAGTPASGSMGLNLTAAHTVIYMSNDYSLKTRLQSEDRVHRPGQIYPVSYYDIVATGPKGQKTIDHTIIKALREKNNIAEWTTRAWISALQD
jgi:SNF2 family DNA or RNA helicase